nr:hypothetical protein [Tanacetum cinerariifolium]
MDTESDSEGAPSKEEESHPLGSRAPLMSEVFEASESSGARTISTYSSASLDSTAPLSPDHPLTHATALSDLAFRKRYRSSYETSSPSLTLLVRKSYRGTSEHILDTDSEGDELGDEDTEEDESLDANDKRERSNDEGYGLGDEDHGLDDKGRDLEGEELSLKEDEEDLPEGHQQTVLIVDAIAIKPLGLGYEVLRRHEIAVGEDQVPSTFEVGQSSRFMPKQQGAKRVSAFRQPTLITWVDSKDGRVYTDIPAYVPLVAPV